MPEKDHNFWSTHAMSLSVWLLVWLASGQYIQADIIMYLARYIYLLRWREYGLVTTDQLRVLARISKIPVQNSYFKISARPDLATYLLQILIPATYNSLVCQKGNLHFSYVLEDGLLRKYLVITPQKSKMKNHHRKFCLSKQEVF